MGDRVQFPVSEMSGEEQHAFALRVSEACPVLAVELDPAHHRVEGQRAELQELQQQPAEMREGAPRDRPAFMNRSSGKRCREIVFRDSADVAKVVKLPILRILRVLLHCCHHARARGVRRRFRA